MVSLDEQFIKVFGALPLKILYVKTVLFYMN